MSTVVKDLGAVSAYAYAVEKGYTGTEAEFAELMADYAEVGQRAEDAADSALESKTAAQTAATTATNKAGEATTAAQTATTKAGEASTSASTATSAKDTAVSASQTATSKATEAAQSATSANTAKVDAVAAKTAAETAQTAAETAQEAAEDAAESVSASAAQIATNTADISDIKENLQDLPNIVEPEEDDADLYVCDENGNVIAEFADGHVKTKNFDSSDVGTNMVKDTTSTSADLYICDTFGNVVAEFKDGHAKTKNFDSSDYVNIPSNVEALLADVSALKLATSGIVYRNTDATDGVYASCRYHQPNSSAKQFCMLMGGDIHGDSARMTSMIEYLNAVDAFDCGIMLGDIAGNAIADDATFYTEAISATERPFLTVLGNHDIDGYVNISELYEKYISPNIQYAELTASEYTSGNTYYYKDFSAYGIRLIVLNQYDYPTDAEYTRSDICYSQAQINWLISTLNSTPSDYGVIIACHTWIGSMTRDTDSILTASTVGGYSPRKLMSGYVVPDIVNAWINGTTLLQTYTYTPGGSWSTLTVNADFTSRGTGEFITYVGGHWHMSILAHVYNYPNQYSYHVDCTGLTASTQGDTPRKIGTRSEDAICALAVDRDLKTVKIFRIGAHFTMDAVDRLYGKYSYATE